MRKHAFFFATILLILVSAGCQRSEERAVEPVQTGAATEGAGTPAPEAVPPAAVPGAEPQATAPPSAPEGATQPPAATVEDPAAGTPLAGETPSEAVAPDPAPTPAPGTAPASVIAREDTNWPGIVAEVTEFRRKGNTLTAKIRLKNEGGDAEAQPDIKYSEAYLMDAAGGKKYEVLKDEKGSYIAALRSGWDDRWYEKVAPGEQRVIWIKFPAPPPDVTSITLQIPGAPPFEDLAIQDS
jgi:hypothetical protein